QLDGIDQGSSDPAGVDQAPAAVERLARVGCGENRATEGFMDLHQIDWENMPWEPVREGITRKAFSGNGATVALHKLMPKHEPKTHAHSYEQIVYILPARVLL